jgi:hypothetical protein
MQLLYEKEQQNLRLNISVIWHVMWQLGDPLVLLMLDRNLQTILSPVGTVQWQDNYVQQACALLSL